MKLVVDLAALNDLPHVVINDLRGLVRHAERRGVSSRSSYADFYRLLAALERADEARLTTEAPTP